MKVLLTGGFGNVGRSTLKALIVKGHNVRVFDIDIPQNRKFAQEYTDCPQVDIIWGDLRNSEDVLRAFDTGVDVVIHLAAVIPPLADKNPELARAVNVGGTHNICAAIKAQAVKPRLIYTSSIAVYGDRVCNPLIKVTDDVAPNDDDGYAKGKLAAEELIQNTDIEWTIFRLTYIVSLDKLEMDPLMFHMPLETSIEICHTEDVGVALANAVEHEEIWGRIFHIAGGEKCRTTYREYIQRMLEIFGLGTKSLPEEAFSTGKFHCGFMDTTQSQHLLQYQQHTLEDYYEEVKKKVGYKRWVTRMVRWVVWNHLLNKSEFYRENRKKKAV
jgi:nucleoside-diphosphate-sugar epimerase